MNKCKHTKTWELERYSPPRDCNVPIKWCQDCGALCNDGTWVDPSKLAPHPHKR